MELRHAARFDDTMIHERLDRMLGMIDIGNGTPVAAALSDLLCVDLRYSSQRDGVLRLMGLTDEDLLDLASELSRVIETSGAWIDLPLGGSGIVDEPGGIEIAMHMLVLDADRPGLHPIKSVPHDPGGANLAFLRSEISRLSRGRPFQVVGLPSPTGGAGAGRPDILRYPPLTAAGGVVLQGLTSRTGAPRFRSALAGQITDLAQSFVDDMRVLWRRRAEIGARVDEVRRAAEAKAAEKGLAVHAITLDLSDDCAEKPVSLHVEYGVPDDASPMALIVEYLPGNPCREGRS